MFLRITVMALLLFVAAPLAAAVWTVEKDGSGDFTVIQDAVDAAATGDSIFVGIGRFDDFREVTTVDGITASLIVHLDKPLTVVGAGMNETIVGPASHVSEVDGLESAAILVDEVPGAVVRALQVENVEFPVSVRSQSEMVECRVRRTGNSYALQMQKGDQIEIRACEFTGGKSVITSSPQVTGPRILDSRFIASDDNELAIVIGNGASGAFIARCFLSGSGGGVQTSLSATAVVEDTVFEAIGVVALDVSSGSLIARRCRVAPGARFPLSAGQGSLEVYDSVIGGGELTTIFTSTDVRVRNSHILNLGGLSVDSRGPVSHTVDLTNNW